MPIDIDPTANPDASARCPRRLLGEGPRCRSLVLVRDAEEHARYHDRLDELLETPVASTVEVVDWPEAPPAADTAAPAPAAPGL